jgi:anti-anti-sigma factor
MKTGTALNVFAVQSVDNVLVVSPQGDSLGFRYNDIHRETNSITDRLQRDRITNLLIDFSDVEIVGSVMISSIIKIARQHGTRKGAAAFCGASPTMREVLENMNLTRLWPCFDSREEALRSFEG